MTNTLLPLETMPLTVLCLCSSHGFFVIKIMNGHIYLYTMTIYINLPVIDLEYICFCSILIYRIIYIQIVPLLRGFRVTRSLVVCVCFVDCCVSFFFWLLCCLSLIYGFWLPHWYLSNSSCSVYQEMCIYPRISTMYCGIQVILKYFVVFGHMTQNYYGITFVFCMPVD